MKLFTTAAVALCLLVFVGCDAETDTPPTPDTRITDASNKVQANITGMDCTGCSGSIVAAVEAIDGVTAAQADVATGDVIVALSDDADAQATKVEVEKVITGLSKGKYTVKTISATTGDAAKSDEAETKPAEKPAADEQAGTEPTEEAFVHISYKVTGMDCSGCSSQIVKAVEQVDGVTKAEADHMLGAVRVVYVARFDDKRKTEEIKDVIAELSDGKYTVNY